METFPIPSLTLPTEQPVKSRSKGKSSIINKYIVAGGFKHLALKDVESEIDIGYSKA